MLLEQLTHLASFSAQVLIIVLAVVILMAFFFYFLNQSKRTRTIEVEHVNDKIKGMSQMLKRELLSKKDFKSERKAEKKRAKIKGVRPRVFVVDFNGDIKATAVDALREEITTILSVANKQDQVIVRLESSGGIVHGYGLAAAQLMRVREHGLKLMVTVDKIAASGGYMMACVADRILAAPFAIVGSIGVVAPVPNFNRLLRKHQIEYKEYTAGDYKRTVSVLGENTPQGIAKFNEQLQETHTLFKDFIRENRPQLDLQQVATGEHWYARQGLSLGLVDEIKTSDSLLMELLDQAEIYKVVYFTKKKLAEKLADAVGQSALRIWHELQTRYM